MSGSEDPDDSGPAFTEEQPRPIDTTEDLPNRRLHVIVMHEALIHELRVEGFMDAARRVQEIAAEVAESMLQETLATDRGGN